VGDQLRQPRQLQRRRSRAEHESRGIGIGGGIGAAPEGYDGHVTFYVEVPDVEAALAKAESLGGSRMMGPEQPMEGIEVGLFNDPEGRTVGVVKSAS
jgi:predicted enzyme related to lactoylglutathione lyase